MGLADILDLFNVVDRLEGFLSGLANADWQGARKASGAAGVVGELGNSLVGGNSWSFHVPREGNWSGASIESFLRHYGITIWGRRITSKHIIFSVKARQARWAEYLLLRRGIGLDGRLYDGDNAVYAQKYAPGDQPPAWADRDTQTDGGLDRLLDFLP